MSKYVFLVAILMIPEAVLAATLSLSPSTSSQQVGDSFNLEIILDTQGSDTHGVGLRYLNYPISLLEVFEVSEGELYSRTQTNSVDTSQGKIEFSQITSADEVFNGSGVLATISFKVLAAGEAAITFDFTLGSTEDTNVAYDGQDILSSVTNGSYTLSSASPPSPDNGNCNGGNGGGGGGGGSTPPAPEPEPEPEPEPAPEPAAHPEDGSLLTSSETDNIYVIINGQKRWIANPDIFYSYGFSSDNVQTISQADLDEYEDGPDLDTLLKEGDLIRKAGGYKVYIINEHKYKRHIFNPAVFNMYAHLKWENIKEVVQITLDYFITSDLYRALGDAKVYSLEEIDEVQGIAIKHWLNMTAGQFVEKGYYWEQVFVVNPEERDYYQTGDEIK